MLCAYNIFICLHLRQLEFGTIRHYILLKAFKSYIFWPKNKAIASIYELQNLFDFLKINVIITTSITTKTKVSKVIDNR